MKLFAFISLLSVSLYAQDTTVVYNVTDYGLVSDGATNNQTALTTLISTVNAAGGGKIYFPNGTYIVSPNASHIYVYDNTIFEGQSKSAIIKVKNNDGDYQLLFNNHTIPINNVVFRNLTIDQNPVGNTTCNVLYATPATHQVTIYFNKPSNVVVEDCSFIYTGVNCLFMTGNNVEGSNRFVCRRNTFLFIPANSTDDNFDTSTIIAQTANDTITYNTFTEHVDSVRSAPITQQARTAIENDWHSALTSYNTCDGFATFCIVAQYTSHLYDVTIQNNTVRRADKSILIDPQGSVLFSNITISDNEFYHNNSDRTDAGYLPQYQSSGIFAYTSNAAANGTRISNLNITGNRIVFQWNPSAMDSSTAIPYIGSTAGISFYTYITLDSITITNNDIVNAPISGMMFGGLNMPVSNFTITGNRFLNLALRSVDYGNPYPNAIYFKNSPASNITIQNNIVDTTYLYVDVDTTVICGGYTVNQGGIQIDNGNHVIVQNDTLLTISTSGIVINNVDDTCNVSDNQLVGLNGNRGIWLYGYGDNPGGIVVSGNDITGFDVATQSTITLWPIPKLLVFRKKQ